MSNNKQTAVEWLVSQIQNMKIGNNQLLITDEDLNYLMNQAKEMEKQQIIDAFGVGCQVESTRLIGYHDMAEQYYNEEYGK